MRATPTQSPFSKRFQREQKRTAILSEAARLFNIHGARATRLSDVAASLELNKTSLYYYVRSKDDLIFETYEASCSAIEELLQRAESGPGDGMGQLTRLVRGWFAAWRDMLENRRPHIAILTEIRALKPAHRKRIAARYSAMYHRVKAMIRRGLADGSLVTDNETDAALAVFGQLQLTVLWLPQSDPADFERLVGDFLDILLNGIAAEPEAWRSAGDPSPERSEWSAALVDDESRTADFCRVGSAFFNRKGFRATSLDDIAEELELTKGSFYYHVADKDDLLRQCFTRSLDIMKALQRLAAQQKGNGMQRLWACARQLFEIQAGTLGPLIRFNLIPSLAPPHRPEVMAGLQGVSDGFGAMIEQGIADGSIRPIDPFIAEQVLLSAIDLAAELPWMRELGDHAAACRSYFRFYFSGLSATMR